MTATVREIARRVGHPARSDLRTRRLLRTWWLSAAAALIIAAALSTNGFSSYNTVFAGGNQLTGTPVPASDLRIIESAALSCPALTGPRLAAQLMATGAFTSGTSGGPDVDGLDPGAWRKWSPWPDAQRDDRRAGIMALAHQTCELVGQLRAAGVTDDPWPAAVAATRAGLQAVLDAKGIPADAKPYVNSVASYADWYSQQSDFRPATAALGGPGPQMPSPPEPKAVPQEYVAAVVKAGRICPTVTPARIAAWLMTASEFDPNKQSANGAQGIAQFAPEVWSKYSSSLTGSPWNPDSAVPALGTALCDLAAQLSALPGRDPYKLALAAYQWGPTAVRAAGGVPKSGTLQSDIDLALSRQGYYEKDPRLAAKPAGSPSPSPSKPTTTKPPASHKPAPPPPPVNPALTYQITNALNGLVLDVPGDDNNPGAGVFIQQWHYQSWAKDQRWQLRPIGKTGYYQILNDFTGKALAVQDGSHDNSARIVQDDPDNDAAQQWRLQYAPDRAFWIINRGSGQALDVFGGDDNYSDAGTIDQYPLQSDAKDQRWRFTR